MPDLVSFEESLENVVRFVEETEPADIVNATYHKLVEGESRKTLLAAGALAVSRSTELPPSHHGGPVHPVSGLYAIECLAKRISGVSGLLPVIQSVALANKHIHSPDMGSAAMVRIHASDLEHLDKTDLTSGFNEAIEKRMAPKAERYLMALLKVAEPSEIMEVMLRVAIPRNALDDHYFLYAVYAFRALDIIGWEHAEVILRPPVRFLCRHPMLEYGEGERGQIISEGIALYQNFAKFEALIDERSLDTNNLVVETSSQETGAIRTLSDRVSGIERISDTPALVADKLAGGLSLMGALEALSVGGAKRFLRSHSGNPFDVHMHTGISARRYLLSLPRLSRRTRLLILLSWGHGYEIRHLDRTLVWTLEGGEQQSFKLDGESQTAVLSSISASIEKQPPFDLSKLTGSIAELVAPASVLKSAWLAQRYVELGHDPEAFFDLMAEQVCRDDQSEMHAYKLQQAAYDEFYATRSELRDVHLISAAKHAAVVSRLGPRTIYPSTLALTTA